MTEKRGPGEHDEGVHAPQPDQSKPTGKRCKAITKSGIACTAWAMPGGLCHLHANPDMASELGRRGGKVKSSESASDATGYVEHPLKSVDDVTKLLADTINGVRSGSIDSRIANTVGYLATGMLKALQQGDVECRLRALEAVAERKQAPPRPSHDEPPVTLPSIYSRLNAPKGN